MRIRVIHNLGDLADDLRTIATTTQPKMVGVVKNNVELGRRTARRIARESSGPHGARYFKRITSEMTGLLEGEWGPLAGRVPVGGGWRHGENTDSARSADIVGPKFAADVHDEAADLFWPGS